MAAIRPASTLLNQRNTILLRLFCSSFAKNSTTNNSNNTIELREISKDRTQQIPLETSKNYLQSEAYKFTYQGLPVWTFYRRNHKGQFPPKKTRKTCVRGGQISTGNPCPICRDEYLVLHEDNVDLLKQFICPHTGSILSYTKTGLCQWQHNVLQVCITRAYNRGILTYDVPFRKYDYSEYIKHLN